MTMANLMPLRGRCSHCHSRQIVKLEDGWFCTNCGQTGPFAECPLGCILRWNGIPEGDCRAPSYDTCYQNETDRDLYPERYKKE